MTVVPRTGPFVRAYAVVGTLEKGRPIQVRRSGRSLERLERVPLEGVTFAPEGALSVRREDLHDCATTTTRNPP